MYFALGFLFYAVLFESFFMANQGSATGVMKTEMMFWPLVLGNMSFAALMTHIIQNWAKVSGFGDGFKTGALVGFFASLGFDMIMFDTTNITTMTAVWMDVLIFTVMSGIAAGIIGLIAGSSPDE